MNIRRHSSFALPRVLECQATLKSPDRYLPAVLCPSQSSQAVKREDKYCLPFRLEGTDLCPYRSN